MLDSGCYPRGTWNKYQSVYSKATKFSHLVVIASGGEVLVVRRPFEAAHFLPVTLQPPLSRRGGSDVPLEDHSVPTSRRQLLPIPCQGTLGTKRRTGRSHISLWLSNIHLVLLIQHITRPVVQYMLNMTEFRVT